MRLKQEVLITNSNYKKIVECLESGDFGNGDRIVLDFQSLDHESVEFVNLIPRLYAIKMHDQKKWDKIQLLNFDDKYLKVSGLPLPEKLFIEPTTQCNLKCPYCPVSYEKGIQRKDMSLVDFKKIIDNYAVAPKVWLWGFGEPLLNKEIFQMAKYVKHKGSKECKTSTNACFISHDNIPKFFTSRFDDIILSVDGASNDTYLRHRKGGNFKRVLTNIHELCKFKRQKGFRYPKITVQFIVTAYNEHEVLKARELFEKLKVDRLMFKTVSVGRERSHFFPRNSQYRRFSNDLQNSKWCYNPWESAAISSEGDITLCDKLLNRVGEFNCGNVFMKDFKSVWNGEKYQNYRKLMLEGKKKLTGVCHATCPAGQKITLKEI